MRTQLARVEIAFEAEIRHDRGNDTATRQTAALHPLVRNGRHQLVAVDHLAVLGDHDDAIGIAVEADADMGVMGDHLLLQDAGVSRAAVAVDVEAIGRHADPNHLRTEFR